jgi:hypothetical protein
MLNRKATTQTKLNRSQCHWYPIIRLQVLLVEWTYEWVVPWFCCFCCFSSFEVTECCLLLWLLKETEAVAVVLVEEVVLFSEAKVQQVLIVSWPVNAPVAFVDLGLGSVSSFAP